MPRTKLHEHLHKHDRLVRLIWGAMAAEGLSVSDMEDRTGISRARLYKRRAKPEDFTIEEITRLGRNLGIPIEELRQSIRY